VTLEEESIAGLRLREWAHDFRKAVREVFQVEPDPGQDEILLNFQESERSATIGSKGTGKTTGEAWCGLLYLLTRPYSEGICTSITRENLRDGLWKELGLWYGRSPILQRIFGMTNSEIYAREAPRRWWFRARGWPKDANDEQQKAALAGLHADHIVYIGDEAGDYPRGVIAAADAIHANAVPGSGKEAKTLLGGNPTNPVGPLGDIDKDRKTWCVTHMTGDPDDPKRSPRVSIVWARGLIAKYGRHHPYVKVNVLGEFPESAINTLISSDDVRRAMERTIPLESYAWAQKRLGVDVSRYGDDPTIIYPRQGLVAFKPIEMRHARESAVSVNIADQVMMKKAEWKSELEFMDATGGWAAGARDIMRATGSESVISVQFHDTNCDPQFFNKRAMIWWRMAEWLKGEACLKDAPPEIIDELAAPTYTFVKGKILLEDKDLVKDRIGRSPNYADALATTFAMVDMPGAEDPTAPLTVQLQRAMRAGGHGQGPIQSETKYNPHARR